LWLTVRPSSGLGSLTCSGLGAVFVPASARTSEIATTWGRALPRRMEARAIRRRRGWSSWCTEQCWRFLPSRLDVPESQWFDRRWRCQSIGYKRMVAPWHRERGRSQHASNAAKQSSRGLAAPACTRPAPLVVNASIRWGRCHLRCRRQLTQSYDTRWLSKPVRDFDRSLQVGTGRCCRRIWRQVLKLKDRPLPQLRAALMRDSGCSRCSGMFAI
jgi:hypothetical protein